MAGRKSSEKTNSINRQGTITQTVINLNIKTMGFFNVECPKCGSEDAYHNGVAYECPECDYEWDSD